MVGWHHRLDGHEFDLAQGDSDGQGSLTYCSPWGHKELDTTTAMAGSLCCLSETITTLLISYSPTQKSFFLKKAFNKGQMKNE